MSIDYGTNNGEIINDDYESVYVNDQRKFYRAFDKLVNNNIIAIQNDPAVNPNNGDSYLSDSTPTGDWTIPFAFYTWRTGVTSGKNNIPVAPFWELNNPAGLVLFFLPDKTPVLRDRSGYYPFPYDQVLNKNSTAQLQNLSVTSNLKSLQGNIGGYSFSDNGIITGPVGGYQLDKPYVYDDDVYYLIDHPNTITNSPIEGVLPANSSLDLLFFTFTRTAQLAIGFSHPNTGGIQSSFVLFTGAGNMSTPVNTPDPVVTFSSSNAKSVCTVTLTNTSSTDLNFKSKAVLL